MHKFSEFANEEFKIEGEKKKIDDILNTEIIVRNYNIKKSKFSKEKEYMTLQFEMVDKLYIIFTGCEVLIEQIQKYKNNIPFITTIKKINKYYTFT